jgi:hypothetical protein
MPPIEDLLDELRRHRLPLGHYVIAASGPIGVRRLREIGDLDVAVDDHLWEQLSNSHGVDPAQPGFHLSTNVEVYREDKFGPDDGLPTIDEQIASAELIDGLPFLRLEHLLELKTARSWPKDVTDVELIRTWIEASDRV